MIVNPFLPALPVGPKSGQSLIKHALLKIEGRKSVKRRSKVDVPRVA